MSGAEGATGWGGSGDCAALAGSALGGVTVAGPGLVENVGGALEVLGTGTGANLGAARLVWLGRPGKRRLSGLLIGRHARSRFLALPELFPSQSMHAQQLVDCPTDALLPLGDLGQESVRPRGPRTHGKGCRSRMNSRTSDASSSTSSQRSPCAGPSTGVARPHCDDRPRGPGRV